METWLRLWRNACLQFWNNSTSCHWQLEVQHHSFIILFVSWYSCRGDKWEHISASFMWKKLMIRLHEFISVGHLYASQAVHVCMWGQSGVSRLHCCPRSRSTQTLTIRCCSLVYIRTSHILELSDLNIVTAELI